MQSLDGTHTSLTVVSCVELSGVSKVSVKVCKKLLSSLVCGSITIEKDLLGPYINGRCMLIGLFPGTFDPPTHGHLHLVKRAASLCDKLIVGVGTNPSKSAPILSHDERVAILKKETANYTNVNVQTFSGLTVDFAKQLGATTLIRGLRNRSDLDSEMEMAAANRRLGIETFFLIADPEAAQISSSLIRQLAAGGAPLKDYIPEELESLLHSRLKAN